MPVMIPVKQRSFKTSELQEGGRNLHSMEYKPFPSSLFTRLTVWILMENLIDGVLTELAFKTRN